MRLLGLDLLAYGPFRGLTLDFSAPGLHVVLGRNEAGKSTTLRAITGLLYGIDPRTTDAHVHKMNELRIGGVLEDAAKRRVRVVRRKGNQNTLLGEAGEPVDESVMKKLLSGVSKESFVHAFGLTHDGLAAGAQALLEGEGDLGESLFDASVGGGGEVQRLVAELRAEAERIYKPRGTTLPLNEALKSFTEAQKAVREKESKPEAFVAQERALEEAIEAQRTHLKSRAELASRRARLDRARRRAPLEKRQQRARERLAELALSLEHVERIGALKERFATYRHALEQRAALLAEAEQLATRVDDSVRRSGLTANHAQAVRLDARTETRINALLRERTKLAAAIEATTRDIAKHDREIARLVEPTASAGTVPPASAVVALSAALERARQLGDVESRLAQQRAQIERKRVDLEAKSTLGGLFAGTLDAFVALRVPAMTTLERVEARWEHIAQTIARLDDNAASLENDAASLEREIAVRSGDFAPPDASALQVARSARDAAWRALLQASDGERPALAVDVERLLREADGVADRMIREADRVTALAQLRSEATKNAEQRARLAAERARAVAERGEVERELAALFADAAITPPHPAAFAEMRDWLARHATIVEAFAEVRGAEHDLRDLEQKGASGRQELAGALAAVGDDLARSRLSELIAAAAQWLATLEAARRTTEEAARQLAKIRLDRDERLAAKERDEAALADVSHKLAELVVPLGVPADASADEVSGAVAALKDLVALADKRADVEARARVLEGTVRDFERDLARAIAELAPDLEPHDPREAAPMLFARAQEAQTEHQELARVSSELEAEEEVVLDDGERALVADVEAVGGALDELDEQIDSLEQQISSTDRDIGGRRAGLEAMKAESNAAEASANAQLHLAHVRELAERWSRVRLAEHVLSREIERYRQENQGPLLATASELFARLTLGSFSGIKAGFDDKDKPCLKCVRADGATEVDMAGLSDGTRDQLYLSLRLASLLRRAEALEPMPVVLDDVLIQVDDQRAAAALAVLAEVSRHMQVLFFTHHARLVELARASVAASELTVHELVSGRYAEETQVAPAP